MALAAPFVTDHTRLAGSVINRDRQRTRTRHQGIKKEIPSTGTRLPLWWRSCDGVGVAGGEKRCFVSCGDSPDFCIVPSRSQPASATTIRHAIAATANFLTSRFMGSSFQNRHGRFKPSGAHEACALPHTPRTCIMTRVWPRFSSSVAVLTDKPLSTKELRTQIFFRARLKTAMFHCRSVAGAPAPGRLPQLSEHRRLLSLIDMCAAFSCGELLAATTQNTPQRVSTSRWRAAQGA